MSDCCSVRVRKRPDHLNPSPLPYFSSSRGRSHRHVAAFPLSLPSGLAVRRLAWPPLLPWLTDP